MRGKQGGQEQEYERQYRKPGICVECPAPKLLAPLGELMGGPGYLEGTSPLHPMSNHLDIAKDTICPERDCDRRD
jgi:hypothetical protein